MRVTSARVIVCSPDRNFATLRVETNDGVHGPGDATLNGRELAVAAYLTEHVIPCLIGRDPFAIEDMWQYLYRGAYWRRGPVTMTAIAAVDVALWDSKGKALNTPVYNLLGGASRQGCMVYTHANGTGIAEAVTAELQQSFALIRQHTTTPLATGEVFNSFHDVHDPLRRQWNDDLRMTVVHAGDITAINKAADFAAVYQVKTGLHGATDLSPVTMAAALHLGLALHNFGIQEHMPHTALTDEVLPHQYRFEGGYMHPGTAPGLGVELKEELAARYPYQRAYLPVAGLHDGTLTDW